MSGNQPVPDDDNDMDKARFLLARLTEEEDLAWGSTSRRDWTPYLDQGGFEWGVIADGKVIIELDDSCVGEEAARHIAMWDPARVLRECEWRRKLIERCKFHIRLSDDLAAHPEQVPDAENRARIHGVATGCDIALDYLAASYADHPDYDEEWRP